MTAELPSNIQLIEVLRSKYANLIKDTDWDLGNHLVNSFDWHRKRILLNLPLRYLRFTKNDRGNFNNRNLDNYIYGTWSLSQNLIESLLRIQPVEYWIMFLNLSKYHQAKEELDKLSHFEEYINTILYTKLQKNEWDNYSKILNEIIHKIKDISIIEELPKYKVKLPFITYNKIDMQITINFMNILLLSILYEFDFISAAETAIFISHIIVFVRYGEDGNSIRGNDDSVDKLMQSEEWNIFINHYINSYQQTHNKNYTEILKFIEKNPQLELLPFVVNTNINEDNSDNEKYRSKILNLRK